MIVSFLSKTLEQNSLGYVLAALIVATVMAATIMILARRVTKLRGTQRTLWAALLASVAGIGVWTTHFVAMLGFRPDMMLAYDSGMTLASAMVGILCVGGPLAISCHLRWRAARVVCGVLSGLGVGAMHFTGIQALRGCAIEHDTTTTIAALVFGAGLIGAAMALGPGRRRVKLSIVLTVAGVCALHFTALFGLSLTPLSVASRAGAEATALSILVVFGALGLSGAAFAAVYAEARLDKQRRQAEHAQARQNEVFSLALRNMSNGLVMVDAEGRISAFNQRAMELLGLEEGDAEPGMELSQMLGVMGRRGGWSAEEVVDFVAEHFDWLQGGGSSRVERKFENGRALSIACRRMPEGGAILTYDDVTEHRAAEQAMTHMAYHDALTGLPNRRGFREEIQRVTTRDGAVAVLMLDLDRFKWVNDTLGHAVGDALLVQVAERLRRICRAEDGIFRLGGDEIAIISQGTTTAEGRILAERVQTAFQESFPIDGHSVGVGCSIGIASTEDGERRKIVEKADLALYRAKSLGRNRVETYESGMMERAIERRQTEIDLSRAIAERQLELRYQPLCELPEGRLLGFEALIRWHHPLRGLVSPADFIPIAEANGMILDIGAWVLDEACRQLARWPEDLHVAVNASAVQMRAPDFLAQVKGALTRHGVAPRRLEIELTETAMVEDGKHMSQVLASLRALGVRIAMDDFGTGYSSLAHLRDFELDRIKIDRSFVDTDLDDVGARAVIRAVTSLARDLSIITIGEGVETPGQLDRLIELGCDVAQGYLIGKPVTAGEANRLIMTRSFDEDLRAEQAAAAAFAAGPARAAG